MQDSGAEKLPALQHELAKLQALGQLVREAVLAAFGPGLELRADGQAAHLLEAHVVRELWKQLEDDEEVKARLRVVEIHVLPAVLHRQPFVREHQGLDGGLVAGGVQIG